jgi:hypothetical protein
MVKPRNPYYNTPRQQIIPNKKKNMLTEDELCEYCGNKKNSCSYDDVRNGECGHFNEMMEDSHVDHSPD